MHDDWLTFCFLSSERRKGILSVSVREPVLHIRVIIIRCVMSVDDCDHCGRGPCFGLRMPCLEQKFKKKSKNLDSSAALCLYEVKINTSKHLSHEWLPYQHSRTIDTLSSPRILLKGVAMGCCERGCAVAPLKAPMTNGPIHNWVSTRDCVTPQKWTP